MKSEDARRFERTVEVRKDEGEYQDPALSKITLRAFWPRFLEASPHLRPSTLALYRGQAEKYLLPAFGDQRLSAITPLDVSAFIAGLHEHRVGDATVSGFIPAAPDDPEQGRDGERDRPKPRRTASR